MASYISYQLGYTTISSISDHIRHSYIKAEGYMIPEQSWVLAPYKTPHQLHYMQLVLNLIEVYRRQLQLTINSAGSLTDINNAFQQTRANLQREADLLTTSTNNGLDTATLSLWEKDITKRLNSLPDNRFPSFPDLNTRLSCVLGMFGSLPAYDTYPLFGASLGTGYGFELGWGKNNINLGCTISGGKILQDGIVCKDGEKYDFTCGTKCSSVAVLLDYGFTLKETCRIRLTPFVGVQYNMHSVPNPTGNNPKNTTVDAPNPYVGVEYNRNLYTHYAAQHISKYGLNPDRLTNEHYSYFLRIRLYAAYQRLQMFEGPSNGLSINLLLAIGFLDYTPRWM